MLTGPPPSRPPGVGGPPSRRLRVRAAGLTVAVAMGLAGCASGDATAGDAEAPATGTVSVPGAPGEQDAESTAGAPDAEGTASLSVRTLEVTVEGTRVDPPPGQVDLATGETLRLVVTSDVGGALHAHGFDDTEVPLRPGEPAQVDLVGAEPGVYEVELHEPDLLLLQLAVR